LENIASMIALVDCNNFYVSCERVFDPSLKGRAVMVLSNNDGCAVARCNLVKSLGIRMGQPAFEVKDLIEKHNIAVFSSNYTLYGDMSERVMTTLRRFTPNLEVYSIDEAFLDLRGMDWDLQEYGDQIKAAVFKNQGIPTCVGIAPTKALAKVANYQAKKNPLHKKRGVFLINESNREQILKDFPIEEVWGIGSRHAARLQAQKCFTALDFTNLPEHWVKKEMAVVGLRLQKELKGIPCLSLELVQQAKKNICTSRSFGKDSTELSTLREAVSCYASRCSFKLRRDKTCAAAVTVFINTNYFKPGLPQYGNSQTILLPEASSDSIVIIKAALKGLKMIFKEGFSYKKAGVIVSEIVPEHQVQKDLFAPAPVDSPLMKILDKLNSRYGQEKVRVASQGFGRSWHLRQEKLSPCYTTRLSEIISVKA
jgi:DNA polymerase V